MWKTAVAVAKEAGELLREGFTQEKEITFKSSEIDWVTQFDAEAEKLIINRLQSKFPDHTFAGEEGGIQIGESRYTWHIDPIDGTANFTHGIPYFGVSLAVYGLCLTYVSPTATW